MTLNPTVYSVPFEDIRHEYDATKFQDLLGDFLASLIEPSVSGQALCNHGVNIWIPFYHMPTFHKIKFKNKDGAIVDCIHIWLEQVRSNGQISPAHFDTVLVQTGQQPGNMGRTQGRFDQIIIELRC
jgi:hypothetical protein